MPGPSAQRGVLVRALPPQSTAGRLRWGTVCQRSVWTTRRIAVLHTCSWDRNHFARTRLERTGQRRAYAGGITYVRLAADVLSARIVHRSQHQPAARCFRHWHEAVRLSSLDRRLLARRNRWLHTER